MTDDAHTLISVRGEAERIVAPDYVHLSTSVSASAATKADASAIVVRAVDQLLAALHELGGQSLGLDSMRASLTWSTQGLRTQEQWDHSDNVPRVVGHRATGEVAILVRDFTLLDELTRLIPLQDEVNLHGVSWLVDDDNPEWARVRADAIHAALQKGRDYATALAGAVIRVEHVADSGLLGRDSSDGSFGRRSARVTGFTAQSASRDEDGVSLDPVPQTIAAVIEARVSATVGPLPG